MLSWVGVSVSDLIEPGVPAFEGESFVGEMDLARSAQMKQSAPPPQNVLHFCGLPGALTSSPSLPLLATL